MDSKNRVKVSIYDMDFTLMGDEDEEYMQKVASHVDRKMRETLHGSAISALAGAVLTAANVADDYFKALSENEKMRSRLKDYFDELSRLKDDNAALRRDIARLDPERASLPSWEDRQGKIDLEEN